MTNAERLELMKDCYKMGRGEAFCLGRVWVIEGCDDIPYKMARKIAALGQLNVDEIYAGVDYQKSIFKAALMMLNGANLNGPNGPYGQDGRANGSVAARGMCERTRRTERT